MNVAHDITVAITIALCCHRQCHHHHHHYLPSPPPPLMSQSMSLPQSHHDQCHFITITNTNINIATVNSYTAHSACGMCGMLRIAVNPKSVWYASQIMCGCMNARVGMCADVQLMLSTTPSLSRRRRSRTGRRHHRRPAVQARPERRHRRVDEAVCYRAGSSTAAVSVTVTARTGNDPKSAAINRTGKSGVVAWEGGGSEGGKEKK